MYNSGLNGLSRATWSREMGHAAWFESGQAERCIFLRSWRCQ